MTNEEKAKEIGRKWYYDGANDVAYRSALQMAKWKEQQMIEKSVEWLKEHAEHYYGVEGEYSNKVDLIFCKEELLEGFKEAMMEDKQ